MKRIFIAFAVLAMLLMPSAAFALTTADVTVYATPSYISISVSPDTHDFGGVAESTADNTTTSAFTVTNGSTVITDQTISVNTADNWTGGIGWIHSDTATIGADQVGLLANKGGVWGTGDIIVKKIASVPLNLISDNQSTGGTYDFGLSLLAPTSFGDGVQKQVTVRVTAAAAI